jgi:hypothetical protein
MKACTTLCALLFAVGINGPVQAQPGLGWGEHFPNDVPETQEGDSRSFHPFTFDFSHFQQVYASSEFTRPLETGGVNLNAMFFRLDGVDGLELNGTVTNLQIRLSTTGRQPDSLSPVFAENIGGDNTLVFGGDKLFAVNHFPFSVQPFGAFFIEFTQPFFYDPRDGNLLVDITLGGSSILSIVDAWDRVGDGVSSLWSPSGAVGTPSTIGVVTRFEGLLVPEPTPIALFLVTSAVLLLLKRTRP